MCTIREAADLAHARYSAARAALLDAVADLEESGAWKGEGAGTLVGWMCARWQIDARTARELVREARALRARPALARALRAGSISVDQSKALMVLCREGTDDDAAWLEDLDRHWPLPELQREARKRIARELERRDGGVYLRMEHTPDERFVRGQFQLHPEDGAVLEAAIEARIPDGTALRDWDHAAARALVELATDAAGTGSSARRPTVLVSVSEATLAAEPGSEGVARVGSDGYVGAETARRLSCDAYLQPLYRDAASRLTGIGRASRVVPPWLRRAVEERDGGRCTFPGCSQTRYLDCHHVRHWADGGPTELGNLLLTCFTHHMLLHEGGWSLRGDPGPRVTWVRPDGMPHQPRVRVVLDTS